MRAGLAGIRGYESERIDHPSARAGPGDEKLISVSHGRTASAGTFQPAPLVYPLWNVGTVLFCRLKLCGSYEREAAFLRRLRDYEAQHLLFLTNFAVDWSNNVSERDLRKAKRHSKVTGGFRDDRGMEAYCTTLTVTETMRRRGIDVWEGILWLLEEGGDVFARDAVGPPGREQPAEQPGQAGQSDERDAA